ncbi:exonuclease III APE [Toxoplasma gondii ME49]|uniref:DNA-(apurinic or apyrimidinic site) endonuclease n=4 Tax=Toxoplasma gondii TaxID=5811 RepID=A0A125YZ00_TOXGV|nr:exonuclease III APE [Toxoplasma gondii ME49]EPT25568.1 exonuclease III APE [Toxoplasma gondii ME49]ESS28690.1 exonuclease III APE [Toxoplasma gondii VEG]|eukprot:XP_018635255.1 exonuclease III APE [Toxoplasma gondii ME49]
MRPLGSFLPSFVHFDWTFCRGLPLAENLPVSKVTLRRLEPPFASSLAVYSPSALSLSSPPFCLILPASLSGSSAFSSSRSRPGPQPSPAAAGARTRNSQRTSTMSVHRAVNSAQGEEETEGPHRETTTELNSSAASLSSSPSSAPSCSVSTSAMLQRASDSSSSGAPPVDLNPSRETRETEEDGEGELERRTEGPKRKAPLSIVTWNVNSIAARIRDSRQWFYFSRFLQKIDPDILCLQEVKLAAHGPPGAKRGDGMPRDHGRIKDSDKVSSVEARELREALHTLLPNHSLLISLADWRYSGQMMFIRKDVQVCSLRYNLSLDGCPAHEHDFEGRVILAEFEAFCVLTTYSPNNGATPKSFERRRLWDERMLQFVTQLKKPLVWVGDLNCAPEDIDLSDPDQFRSVIHETADGTIDPDNIGQAGCTDAERRRFRAILERGNLVDAFRELHPRTEPPPLESAEYSWRGFGGSGSRGLLRGLGMRLDHIVLTETLMPAVELVRICGAGKSKANFFGSDHCPVLVLFKEKEISALPAVVCEALRSSAPAPAAKKRQDDCRLDSFFAVKRRAQLPGAADQKRKKPEEVVISDSSDEERKTSQKIALHASLEKPRNVQASS